MTVREIDRNNWDEFFESFSRRYRGWLVNVQVAGQDARRRFEAKGLPFQGIAMDDKGTGQDQVSIFMNRELKENLTHIVSRPTRIRLQQNEEGADQGIEVEAGDGTKTIVQFVNPARPDLVDGI